MNETILHFLQQQSCASICCMDEDGTPYCFSCYYAFNADDGLLYFKSSVGAHHASLLQKYPNVAGTILPGQLNKLITRGIQFQGTILSPLDPLGVDAVNSYHKKYPIGLAMKGEVFTICLNDIKMTDSTLGFGKKITWKRNEPLMADTADKVRDGIY